jgi:hypothetical protein
MRIGRTALALICLCLAGQARASGDTGCEPRLRPGADVYSACDNFPLLAPGNDTRVNLALLMADRHGVILGRYLPEPSPNKAPPQIVPFEWYDLVSRQAPPAAEGDDGSNVSAFSTGEGTTCVSDESGRNDFLEALQAESGLSESERSELGAARGAMACQADGAAAEGATTVGGMHSAAAEEFRRYLDAIGALYAGTYDPDAFDALARGKQAWIREASLYMVGRTWALRGQQQGFDDYGDIDREKMDRASLDKSLLALTAYLEAYPDGRYAASARGLMRRVHWLAGDFDALASDYRWQIEQADARKRNLGDIDLAMEIDAKLPLEAYAEASMPPLLLAVDDLRRMRRDGIAPDGSQVPVLARTELEAQKPRFPRESALYQYLLAAHAWFVENRPDAVLHTLKADDGREALDTLGFSRQLLRALALDAINDKKARPTLLALLPRAVQPHQRQTVELALAMHDERANALSSVFADDSQVRDGVLRERLLVHAADADLLRARVRAAGVATHEGAVALYVLLYKELTRGRYGDFLADLKLLPTGELEAPDWGKTGDVVALADFRWDGTHDGYRCPSLQQVATLLARTPQAHGARLCLAEFLRLNDYDYTELDQSPPPDELGGAPSRFAGKALARMDVYQATIADAAASAEDKAYALYRAINCYAPSGNNECGGDDVPVEARKAWFRRLKSEYPQSSWAQGLKYYW